MMLELARRCGGCSSTITLDEEELGDKVTSKLDKKKTTWWVKCPLCTTDVLVHTMRKP